LLHPQLRSLSHDLGKIARVCVEEFGLKKRDPIVRELEQIAPLYKSSFLRYGSVLDDLVSVDHLRYPLFERLQRALLYRVLPKYGIGQRMSGKRPA
jgi:hypothetical protein